MIKYFSIIFSLVCNFSFAKIEYGTSIEQQETLEWTFQKAQKFSGIYSKSPDNWKTLKFYLLTDSELSKQICPDDPENCHGLAAVYDTNTKSIYIREDVNPDLSMINISFLLHEMVHALQHEFRSEDDMFGNCQKLYNTEKEAYAAQDDFLKSEGQFFRAGNALRFFICN